jgi:hypothetical protein
MLRYLTRLSCIGLLLLLGLGCSQAAEAPPEQAPVAPAAEESAQPSAASPGASLDSLDAVALGSTEISVSRIRDNRLAELLGAGSFRTPTPDAFEGQPPVHLRLWSVSREGSCVEDTHSVCQYDYILTLLAGDLGEIPGVFLLGRVGEITDFAWTDARDPWLVRLTVSNYPPESHRPSSPWTLTSRVVELAVSYDSVWVRK